MAYAMGDTVVHPRHGIATVRGIAARGVGSSRTNYLELAFPASSLSVLVPLESVVDVGIRSLATRAQVAAILADLARDSEVPEAWAERTATTASRMESTELAQASKVVRDLTRHARRSGKALSHSEDAILKTCINAVSAELSLVLEISHEDAHALILGTVLAEG